MGFPTVLVALVVCVGLLCLYQGGPTAEDDGDDGGVLRRSSAAPPVAGLRSLPVCDARLTEVIPCLDRELIYQLKLKLRLEVMEHYERRCPAQERRMNCLVAPPRGYRIPVRWPGSRDEVWKANIPHTHLADEKSDQNWMVVRGEKISFPGGGTHFHRGADKYIAALAKMLGFPGGDLSNEGRIRTVLDVGCGVASFGAYLLALGAITMSLAPNDVHQNQIQFALERGVPAALGVLGTKRLPFPSHSFDLAHCSRCRIDWLQRDGILLLELDRLLRPGGFFVLSSPEAYAQDPDNRRIWSHLTDLLKRMCWRIAAKKDQSVIWIKPRSNRCYRERAPDTRPLICGDDVEDPDAAWNVPLRGCISPYPQILDGKNDSGLAPWPRRLSSPPPRLEEIGISAEAFKEDTEIWRVRVAQYWKQMRSAIDKHTIRNVMDMRSNIGGFAAALASKDVWVMNVVPVEESSKLKIIYDRGLIGSLHDWCESFSTYPRTYDLLHAWWVFSGIRSESCGMEDLLIEMDRIIRPLGFIIIRDDPTVITLAESFLTALRWDGWSSTVPQTDALSDREEKVLIARKRFWREEESDLRF
ncbi:putative methyltransferase PMT9 [Wolffia australiana]